MPPKGHGLFKVKHYFIRAPAILVLLIMMFSHLCCGGSNKLRLFDKVITQEVALGEDAKKLPFSAEISEKPHERNYSFIYQFKTNEPYHHYICSISTAIAGTFFDASSYNIRYDQLKEKYIKTHPSRWKKQLLLEFPKIGKRAQYGVATAGPGGAAYELFFTTSDGRYDLKVVMSSLLPDHIESPNLDIEKIAMAVSNHYDKRF